MSLKWLAIYIASHFYVLTNTFTRVYELRQERLRAPSGAILNTFTRFTSYAVTFTSYAVTSHVYVYEVHELHRERSRAPSRAILIRLRGSRAPTGAILNTFTRFTSSGRSNSDTYSKFKRLWLKS